MTNIAKKLKNCPERTILYSPLFGEVEFAEVMDTSYMPIRVTKRGYGLRFDKYGRYMGKEYPDAECLLFPTKDHRTWEDWETPVVPKFKVGDWICRGEGFVYEPSLITEIKSDYYVCELNGNRVTYTFGDVHNNFHLWTIQDAKDGDVLVYPNEIYQDEIFLFNLVDNNSVLYYCCFDGNLVEHSFYGFSNEELLHVHPATKEQRDLLFKKIREAGYEWDSDKKELKKIKSHYDISNFKAGMPVLVRDTDGETWAYNYFSHIAKDERKWFNACGWHWNQCIPYEGNEHLLGTTDMCDEQFINW